MNNKALLLRKMKLYGEKKMFFGIKNMKLNYLFASH